MRCRHAVCASLVAAGLVFGPAPAFAQEPAQTVQQQIDQLRRDFEALKQEYDQRITALEQKLGQTPGQTPAQTATPTPGQTPGQTAPAAGQPPAEPTAPVPPGAEGAGGPSGALPVYGGAVSGSKVFNPD